MKIEIKADKENPLLERREIRFQIESKTTPTRAEVKEALANALHIKPELLVIDKLSQVAGTKLSTGYAKVYKSADILKSIELDYKLQRGVKKVKEGGEPAEAAGSKPTEPKPAAQATA